MEVHSRGIEAGLFDLDGTLIDSIDLILRSYHHTLEAHGKPSVTDAQLLQHVGIPLWAHLRPYATDEAEMLRSNVRTFIGVAEQLAATVDRAPDEIVQRLAVEREAAINQIETVIANQRDAAILQIADAVRAEREALLTSLESEEPRVQALLTELRQTIESTTRLVDALAVLVPEAPPDVQREPIDIADVRAIVEQTTLAANGLNTLVQSIDRALAPDDLQIRLTQLDLALSRAEARGQSLIDRTFILAGLVVVLIFAGSMVKMVIQRRVTKRVE